MTTKQEMAYLAYAGGWSAVRKMPERTAYQTFDVIADRLWSRRGGGVQQLEKNLARVRPEASYAELRKLSRQSMRSYFRYWCDAFRIADWSETEVVQRFEGVNAQYLHDALKLGKGVIVALPHMGNWDHAGAWATLDVGPLTAIAEKLEPEKLFDKFVSYRESIGLRIHALGTPGVVDTLADELRNENRIVALLADRDLTARGIDVTLFGSATRMPAGPANLALRTGAPLFAATLWYDKKKAYAKIHPQIQIPAGAPSGDDAREQPGYDEAVSGITQQIANAFEEGIREHPADWHMMQKLWLEDLDPQRLAATEAKRRAMAADG